MSTHAILRATSRALLASTALAMSSVAVASTAPRFVDQVDDHGVDLATGLPFFSMEEGGIGSGPGRITVQRIWAEGAGWEDNWTGGLYPITSGGVTKMYVQFGGISDTFSGSGTSWTADKAEGETLTVNSNGNYIYTARDGTTIQFSTRIDNMTSLNCPGGDSSSCQVPQIITKPNGIKFTLTWAPAFLCTPPNVLPCGNMRQFERLAQVKSSAGYSVAFTYGNGPVGSTTWWQRISAVFNNSVSAPNPLPTITYAYPSSGVTNVTDPAGRTWVFTQGSSGLAGIQRPGSSSNNITYSYGSDFTVNSATRDGVTNSYSRSVVGSTATETVTDPLSHQTVVTSDTNLGRPTSYKDALNHTTSNSYDANARLSQVTAPEGNYTQYAYDARGNVTTTTNVAKSGSGLANIVTTASFDSTCTNVVKCNEPNSTTDAKNNTTNYTYDPTHGGILTATLPAPTTGAVQPQTRYSYTQVTSATGDLVYMLTGTSACQTTASCIGTADETKSTIAYNSNLLPTSVTNASGDGALSAATTYAYDTHGNVTSVDGPLAGTADTTAYKYDAADQRVGTISPNPGNGQPDRAIRLTYRPDGQASKREIGTVTDQSDTAWTNFTSLSETDIGFDANSRPTTSEVLASGTAYSLSQTSYDADGRPQCVAVRMNTAVYGSLPSSACTLSTQGSFGADQISKTVYDAAGEVTQLQEGVGTSVAANERTLTYNPNGTIATLTDANNNVTSYTYDGFDRLTRTTYPGGSTQQITLYDANGNADTVLNRAGQSFSFAYDALNRVTSKSGAVPTVNYTYDNLDRMLTATFARGGLGITNAYDALSRLTSSSSNMSGTAESSSYQYDLSGRRTQLTYYDGYFINYDYLTTGEVQKIRENGATSGLGVLATYAYDNLGRRSSLTLGNGTSTTYGYDPVSRLTSLAFTFAGTANNLTKTLSYDPANEIVTETRSNDAFAANPGTNVSRSYTVNGLNQYTAAGPATFSYDTNGNLTSDGTNTFGYDAENHLTSATVGGLASTSTYDPIGRLWQFAAGTGGSRTVYDGLDALTAQDETGILWGRTIYGAATGELLVQYKGQGAVTRQFLATDERGSVIALSDDSGNVTAINHYDEYGLPAASNSNSTFTGQAYSSGVGLYNYKARMYSTTLGRFMQTDPIGYADGPNWYAYVHNDPVNYVDPSGLCPGSYVLVAPSKGRTGGDDPNVIYVNGGKCKPVPTIGSGSGSGGTAGSVPGGGGGRGGMHRVTPQDIQAAQDEMIKKCHADPTSAACAAAQKLYLALNQAYAQQNPTPMPAYTPPPTNVVRDGLVDGACAIGVAGVVASDGLATLIPGAATTIIGCADAAGLLGK